MKTKTLLLLLFCLAVLMIQAQETSRIQGKVVDANNHTPIIFSNIELMDDNRKVIAGTESDLDGNFIFSNLKPGLYSIKASYVGYEELWKDSIKVDAGRSSKFDIQMEVVGYENEVQITTCFVYPNVEFNSKPITDTINLDSSSLPCTNLSRIFNSLKSKKSK